MRSTILLTSLLSALLSSTTVNAQFEVFKTIDDLVNETPIPYEGFDYHKSKGSSDMEIILRKEGSKEERVIDCTTIWGFAYKGELFRVMRHGKFYEKGALENFPVKLVLFNGAFYWENGNFLYALKNGLNTAELNPSYTGFVSATVDGDAFLVTGLMKGPGWVDDNGDLFFAQNPELKWLQDCVREKQKRGYLHENITTCIKAHPTPEQESETE